MIHWTDLENHLKIHNFYIIDNNKSKNIILFGNCHCLPIVYYLNMYLNKDYNFIVIVSWFYEKVFDKEKLEFINKSIMNYLYNCDVLIYQNHNSDFGINASSVFNMVPYTCKKICIPNLMLDFLSSRCNSTNVYEMKACYEHSLERLHESINNSNFKNFLFINQNINHIRFFNSIYHPTHFILYLLSKNIIFKIQNLDKVITINDYWDNSIREDFLNINLEGFVFLPGKDDMELIHHQVTNINFGCDYFDINF